MRGTHRFGNQRLHFSGQRDPGLLQLISRQLLAARIELGQEQLHQQAGDGRIAIERVFHVALREGHAGLQQVLAVATQHRHLAPAQLGTEHEPVEAVVLGIAAEDLLERIFKQGTHLLHAESQAAGGLHLEVLDVERRAVDIHVVEMLGQHAQTQVLQLRQHFGERNVAAAAVDLEAKFLRARGRVIERHAHVIAALQQRELAHVFGGSCRRYVFHVASGHGLGIAIGQHYTVVVAQLGHQRIAQVVLPVAHDGGHALLEFGHVVGHLVADLRTHHHVQSDQCRLAHQHRGVEVLPAHGIAQQRFDPLAHRGVEAVARHEHRAGDEAAVAIATNKQPRAGTLAQFKDAHRDGVQLILAGLEQLVARQDFQNVAQRLARMRITLQTRAIHHVLELLAHQRHVLRTRHVGAGGEQSQEALFGRRLAIGVKLEHADVIHVALTMRMRARVRLGQDDGVGGTGLRQIACHQRAQRTRRQRALALVQDTHARRLDRTQHVFAIGLGHFVFAVTKESKVVVREPVQEGRCFLHPGRIERQLARRQVGGDGQRFFTHLRPVGDGNAHIFQRAFELGLELGLLGLACHAVHLEVHHRFGRGVFGADLEQLARSVTRDVQHRMDHRMYLQVRRRDHGHRIDQERHVVGNDLDVAATGMTRGRVKHAHRGTTRLSPLHELQQVGDQRGPFGRGVQFQVAGCNALKENADKKLRLIKALGRKSALLQFFENNSGEGAVASRTNRVHGIYCFGETE